MQEIIKVFNATGNCIIDVDALEKSWDHRFLLTQWGEEYRLVQYLRKGSSSTKIKCDISQEQANDIIKKLKLVSTQTTFTSGKSWRKEGQSEFDMLVKKRTAV